jgi:hypothetical protein
MKIAAYTIALNEINHCERWAESVKDADYRVVLDTGSTDGTVEKLRELGVTVFEHRFDPWRFDHSRNMALACVPEDAEVCISLDMDEFMGEGYRAGIEKVWIPGQTTRLHYTYVFDYKPDGNNAGYQMDKIHHRIGYQWKRPVHENVWPTVDHENFAVNMDVHLNQIQDRTKPTRGNYLPLMKVGCEEDPNDSQMSFWYGRELMFAGQHDDAVQELKRFLEIPSSQWPVERSEAMIYISKMVDSTKLEWLMKALSCAPTRRQVWLELVLYYYDQQDWHGLLWAAGSGMEKSKRDHSYLDNTHAWGNQFLDFGSLAASHLGWHEKAYQWCSEAIAQNPTDERIQNNLRYMQSKLGETSR